MGWNGWDKLKAFGYPAVAFGVVIWLFIIGCVQQQSAHVDERLARWKKKYHLSDEQVVRLREIERNFHGSGNPFTSIGSPSPEEVAEHHRGMSKLMSPDDGRHFLEDMSKSPVPH